MIPYEKKEHYTIDDLAEIVTLLRSKDGCPWDKVQTHESIRPDLIEETYEVIEAIDQNDPEMLREELGDLLLQVVFHSRIETEQGHFTLDDVCTDICNKLIIRHPHVFSTVQADTTEEVLKNWDTIKEETKHQTTRTQTLEAVAKTLPALMRAQKVCKRALKGNNRFLCNESVLASVTECKHTLEEAMHMEDAEQITRAMGELLFCCAGMAQTLGLSAEQVLTDTTNQFIDCFRAMEETCTAEKREMETLSHGEWNALWKKTKQNLEEEATMRLDKYLKISRLIKRRTVANEACDAGKILVNDKVARASYDVKAGDVIEIQMGQKALKVRVEQVAEVVRKEDAAGLYAVVSE